jgi:hypothetical protein
MKDYFDDDMHEMDEMNPEFYEESFEDSDEESKIILI